MKNGQKYTVDLLVKIEIFHTHINEQKKFNVWVFQLHLMSGRGLSDISLSVTSVSCHVQLSIQ